MATEAKRSRILYAVNIRFVGKPDFYSRQLSTVVKILTGWYVVYESGLMLPLIDEPIDAIDRRSATIDLSHCTNELDQLYGFFIGKERREGCEDYPLPHMHFVSGGIEEIGAIYDAFYLPSIAREACVDTKITALIRRFS